MIDEAEKRIPAVDMGALAQGLRPVPNSAAVVLWWAVFTGLVGACVYPHPAAVAVVWVYVVVLAWHRHARRKVFLRNLAGLPCFSRGAMVEPPGDWPKVTVVVPARDEEEHLDEAARSLAALTYPKLDVWFVNDHSTDRTPRILEAIGADFPHVHVLHDPPVNEGWFGKSNALWQAFLEIEREQDARDRGWLLFADADVVFEPGMLEQAVALVERERMDFLTVMPRLITGTWAEQLLLPTGWRGIVQGADPERLNDPRSFPIGIGAFMMVSCASYRAWGGHRALAQWHPEDTLMAAAVKQIGGRVGFAWTPDLLRVRFYHGYGEVKKHTLRKMRIFFGDHLHLPLTMIALRLSTTLMAPALLAAGLVPQVAAGRFDEGLTLLAAAGFVLYVDEAREYRGAEKIAEFHPLLPWLHPVSGVLRVWFALSLMGQILAGRPMEWRGRREFGETGDGPAAPDRAQ